MNERIWVKKSKFINIAEDDRDSESKNNGIE